MTLLKHNINVVLVILQFRIMSAHTHSESKPRNEVLIVGAIFLTKALHTGLSHVFGFGLFICSCRYCRCGLQGKAEVHIVTEQAHKQTDKQNKNTYKEVNK